MAVKIADTLKAMSNTFPVAECVDIDVNINGTTKRLQKAIDDGEIGGGSDSTWKGTHEEWEALSTEEKGKYEVICFTDDYDESGICGSDSTWKGTHEEWEALSTEEKGKYEVVYFTDDYDESGIGGSDSIWKGTRDEWEALSPTDKEKYEIVYFTDDYDSSEIVGSYSIWKGTRDEWEALSTTDKEKYEIVCFTNDYDGANSTGLIDDTNTSGKTTYSSSKIENSLSKKANTTDLTVHTSDTNIHVTTSDKTKWNNSVNKTDIVDNLTSTNTDKPLSAKQGKVLKDDIGLKANATDLTSHTSDTNIHITTAERTKWNKVDNKVDKTNIVDNLTSTDTDKPLSAKQGKILKDEIGLKANATDLTAHTGNTGVHITASERTKWNKVDNKVDKTDITTTIDSTSTDSKVPSAKAVNELNLRGTRIDQSVIDKYGTEIVKYPLGRWYFYNNSVAEQFSDLPVKLACIIDITSISNTGNPWDNIWSYRIYKAQVISNQGSFVRQLQSRETPGVLADTGWQRLCATSVANVPKTNITLNNGFTGVAVSYEVKNGVCYINIDALKSEKTGQDLIVSGTLLPKPSIGVVTSTINFDRTDVKTGMVYIDTNSENKLRMHCYKANTDGWCTFSYPVAES